MPRDQSPLQPYRRNLFTFSLINIVNRCSLLLLKSLWNKICFKHAIKWFNVYINLLNINHYYTKLISQKENINYNVSINLDTFSLILFLVSCFFFSFFSCHCLIVNSLYLVQYIATLSFEYALKKKKKKITLFPSAFSVCAFLRKTKS